MGIGITLQADRVKTPGSGGTLATIVDAAAAAITAGQHFLSGTVHQTRTAAGSEGHRYRSALVKDRAIGASSLVRPVWLIVQAVEAVIPAEVLVDADGQPLEDADAITAATRAWAVTQVCGSDAVEVPAPFAGKSDDDPGPFTWLLQPNPDAVTADDPAPATDDDDDAPEGQTDDAA